MTGRSVSALINEMIREQLAEDAGDRKAFHDRGDEPVINYESLLQDLQDNGKLLNRL